MSTIKVRLTGDEVNDTLPGMSIVERTVTESDEPGVYDVELTIGWREPADRDEPQ